MMTINKSTLSTMTHVSNCRELNFDLFLSIILICIVFFLRKGFETTAKAETSTLQDEIFETSKQEAANISTDNLDSNDDDIMIPETQDIFSQESVESSNSSLDVSQHDKSEVEKITNHNQPQPNMSVMSISSDEEPEISQITFTNVNGSVIKNEDIPINVNQLENEKSKLATQLENETEGKLFVTFTVYFPFAY